mmetsp:Transcript_49317/g.107400  ORF Transcript_49317/g.107400 Transcript_49317/m.107400 type:complete len:128 (-) Transcript_49317:575-958(-)
MSGSYGSWARQLSINTGKSIPFLARHTRHTPFALEVCQAPMTQEAQAFPQNAHGTTMASCLQPALRLDRLQCMPWSWQLTRLRWSQCCWLRAAEAVEAVEVLGIEMLLPSQAKVVWASCPAASALAP